MYRNALETGQDDRRGSDPHLHRGRHRQHLPADGRRQQLRSPGPSARPPRRRSAAASLESGLCATTLGLIQRDAGDLKDATSLLERAVGQLRECDAKRELATALFHLAGIHFSLKRKKLALEAMEEVASLVTELGYDHFVHIEAARNPLLVQYAAANKLAGGYFGRLLKTMKGARQAAAPVRMEEEAGDEPRLKRASGVRLRQPARRNRRARNHGPRVAEREEQGDVLLLPLQPPAPCARKRSWPRSGRTCPDEKTTSAFHSNMYRLRKALYQDCIAKDSGRYILDPRGQFVFDVERFQKLAGGGRPRAQGKPRGRLAHGEGARALQGLVRAGLLLGVGRDAALAAGRAAHEPSDDAGCRLQRCEGVQEERRHLPAHPRARRVQRRGLVPAR